MTISGIIKNTEIQLVGEFGGSILNEYNFTIPPGYVNYASINQIDAEKLAESFIKSRGVTDAQLDLRLLAHFVAVYHYVGKTAKSGSRASGWIVGGHVPHLELSDAETQTPIEALAIYAYFQQTWLNAKGVVKDDGSVPDYRIPPDWELLSYTPGYEDWHFGAITSYMGWTLVRMNPDGIKHPDIREYCVRRGWLQE